MPQVAVLAGLSAASAAAFGFIGARAGRKIDQTNKLVAAERSGVAELYHTAYHDALTGLRNRHALSRDVNNFLAEVAEGEVAAVVMLMDLDRFKYINDTMGHAAGDEVLLALTRRLRSAVDFDCRVYRLGGDEFVILWEGSHSEADAETLAGEIAAKVFRPVPYSGGDIETSGSLGITFFRGREDSLSAALKRADLALYSAKEATGASFCFYNDEMDRYARARRAMENDLREGVNGDRFTVFYKPVRRAGETVPHAFVAEARWNHPFYGDVAPDLFLSMALETGVIPLIHRWLLKQVAADMKRLPGCSRVALRVSLDDLVSPDFMVLFRGLMEDGLAADRLIFDLDNAPLAGRHVRGVSAAMAEFGRLGIRFSINHATLDTDAFDTAALAAVAIWRLDMSRLNRRSDLRGDVQLLSAIGELARASGVELRLENAVSEVEAALVTSVMKAAPHICLAGTEADFSRAAAMIKPSAARVA